MFSDSCQSYQRGNVRLSPIAYQTSSGGLVEMCHNDNYVNVWKWGAIRDSTTWTNNDAQVVCRELGLPTSG